VLGDVAQATAFHVCPIENETKENSQCPTTEKLSFSCVTIHDRINIEGRT
jgi:hypothetical protein